MNFLVRKSHMSFRLVRNLSFKKKDAGQSQHDKKDENPHEMDGK